MFRFTIRDVLWLTVVVVVGVASWITCQQIERFNDIWRWRAGTLEKIAILQGWKVRWTEETVDVNTRGKLYHLRPTFAPSEPVNPGE